MLQFEREAWQAGHHLVAGVDEAGRGPLAGPVSAGAVYIPQTFLEAEADGLLSVFNDSKKLTEAKRESCFEILQTCADIYFGVGLASVEEIDSMNILNATHLAMRRAIEACDPQPEYALVDGRPVKNLPCPSKAIVKGDSKSLLIAAASIAAKVTRDHIMLEIDEAHPEYGFAGHKGYGTAAHLEAIKTHGPCPHHRRSFRPIREPLLPGMDE